MTSTAPRLLLARVVAVTTVWLATHSAAQTALPTTDTGEWPTYGGDLANTRYSPLGQIDPTNFAQLDVAWRFKTDNLGPRPEFKLEGTPLMVGGVLYATAGTRRSVIALDAGTGELFWVHGEPEGERGAAAPRVLSGRGLPTGPTALSARRNGFYTSRSGSDWSRSMPPPARGCPTLGPMAGWI